jgi:hypothetical protein
MYRGCCDKYATGIDTMSEDKRETTYLKRDRECGKEEGDVPPR